MSPTRCKRCGESIRWVATENGKLMPLDATPDPAGNVYVSHDATGRALAVVVSKGNPHPSGIVYMPHFARCVGSR